MRIPVATKIHDVTLPFSPAFPVWPGDPAIEIREVTRTAQGEVFNTSQIVCPTHCCTHVDPPWHIIDDGQNLDQIPLERWVGQCQVVGFADEIDFIEPRHLESAGIAKDTTRLLLKTRNSQHWIRRPLSFDTDFVALSLDAARWIIEHGIELIGVDALSFERFDSLDDAVHRMILGNGIVAIEGLNLATIEPGFYDLICLPLRIVGGDGAPARVILLEHDSE
jgi:arylformamidase